MVPNHALTIRPALITRVASNRRGFQIEGEETWINLSKFATPDLALPPAGTYALIGIDKDGFCRSIEVLPAIDAPATTPATTPVGPGTPPSSHPTPRDSHIARMKALELALSAQTLLSSDLGLATVSQWVALAQRITAYILTGEFSPEGADHAGS